MISQIVALLELLPKPLVTAIFKVVKAVVASDDPLRAAKRAALAAAASEVSEAALKKALG